MAGSLVEKPLFHATFYLSGFALLYAGHRIYPTNLAGPGLDLFVIVVMILCVLYLVIKTLFKRNLLTHLKLFIFLIHILGIAAIGYWMAQAS
jgi:hypothetical protein